MRANLSQDNCVKIFREVKMYTIKVVAQLMEVSEHTIRFWAKSGFFLLLQGIKTI